MATDPAPTASLGETIVSLRDVTKSFGLHTVLNGISLDVAKGETICIVGPSGSGKSTLIRCINRMHEEIPGARAEGRVLLPIVGVQALDLDRVPGSLPDTQR